MNDQSANLRVERRVESSFSCPCRIAGCAITNVTFFDISSRGAKVRIEHLEVNVGDKIQLFLEDQAIVSASVRRVGPDYAGVEFDDAVPLYVLDRFPR